MAKRKQQNLTNEEYNRLVIILFITILVLLGLMVFQAVQLENYKRQMEIDKSYAAFEGIQLWNTQVIRSIQERGQIPFIADNQTYFYDVRRFCRNGTTTPD